MLELFIKDEYAPDPERMPVTTELIEGLREVFAEGANGGYDIDTVLFHLALAIQNLEVGLVQRQAQILSLETRILQAGLRVRPPD